MWESKVTQALWKANLATAIDIENEQFFHLLILHLKDMFAEVQKKKYKVFITTLIYSQKLVTLLVSFNRRMYKLWYSEKKVDFQPPQRMK